MVQELKTQYLTYYKDLTKQMMSEESIYQQMINKMVSEFDGWGLITEKKSELLAQTVMTLIPQFEQMAEKSAMDLMTLESELPIKDNQALEVKRKIQYYDDRLLETIVEKQSDLASFAVNSNSNSAQATINDLKTKMKNVEGRVVPLEGNDCPAPEPIVQVPIGFNVVATSDTVLTVSWSAVHDATLYALYRDGIQVASGGALEFVDTNLTQLTKYSYNVKAFSGSYYSDLSQTIVGTTLATIP